MGSCCYSELFNIATCSFTILVSLKTSSKTNNVVQNVLNIRYVVKAHFYKK